MEHYFSHILTKVIWNVKGDIILEYEYEISCQCDLMWFVHRGVLKQNVSVGSLQQNSIQIKQLISVLFSFVF